jgi:outer membrane protein TolC
MHLASRVASSRVSIAACCLWLALVCPPIALASPAELTLEQALRIAVARAPLIDASRAGVTAARQEAARAGALPDPMLTVGIANLPVTGADAFDPNADFMTMKKIGLRQEIPSRAKRESRASLAQREVDEARAAAGATRLAVRRATADAWIQLWAAQRELAALQALRSQAELAAQLAKARVSGGGASVVDALAAEAARLELDNRVEAARAERSAAQAALARWLGESADVAASDSPDFDALPHSQAELLDAIDRLGPLLPVVAGVETAASAIDVARAEKHPDWSVAASYGQRSGGSDMLMFEVGIGLPLFTRTRQDRGIAAREAEYRAALAMREDLRRQEAARIRAGVARWEGLKRQIALHEDALLPLAHDRSTTALAAYRAGGPLQPWLDARRDELAVHLSHVTHLRELGLAWAALAFLLPEVAP